MLPLLGKRTLQLTVDRAIPVTQCPAVASRIITYSTQAEAAAVDFKDARPEESIPSPKGRIKTALGMLSSIRQGRLHRFLTDVSRDIGPIFAVSFGPTRTVSISDPDMVRDIFRQEAKYPERIDILPWTWYKEHFDKKKGVLLAQVFDLWPKMSFSSL